VSRDRGKVSKNQQKRHVGQGKLPGVLQSYVLDCFQIQRNSAWTFLFSINEELRSVVKEHFNEKLFFQILDTECVAGKRVLVPIQFPS